MCTTLTIDNKVLDAAKIFARHHNSTLGSMISVLAHGAFTGQRPQISLTDSRCNLPVLTRHSDGASVDLGLVYHPR